MPYETIKPGEWLRPVRKGYKMQCCDCGLVHTLDFRVIDGRAEFRAFRDNRATASIRRRVPLRRQSLKGAAVDGPKAEMPNRSGRRQPPVSRRRPNRAAHTSTGEQNV